MGVRRISVGGTLARVAMNAFIKSAREIAERRQVRQLCRRNIERRTQQILPRRPRAPAEAVSNHVHPQTGQPIGAPVDDRPASRPGTGDAGRPLRPGRKACRRARRLAVGRGQRPRRRSGPICRTTDHSPAHENLRPGWISAPRWMILTLTRLSIAADRAVGISTLMEIRPTMRVIEVGHVIYSPALQRTPLGTEAQYLLARYAFETLGYRRYEWKCHSHSTPPRAAPRCATASSTKASSAST